MNKLIDLIKKHIKMKRYIWQILLCAILAALLFSCSRELHTGRYIIESVNGKSTVNFKGINGDWHVPGSDTLKAGDTIFLKRVFREKDANVW